MWRKMGAVIELALKMKNVIQAKAKEKQQGGQGGILLLQKSEKANRKEQLVRNLTN